MAIKKGNKFANSIVGTGGPDTIYGFEGNDTLRGQGGNDKLLGGTGNDKLYGGSGNDTLLGEAGNDTLYGEAGNDSLSGGDGNDTQNGDAGNDTLAGGTGNDRLNGGANNDRLSGDAGTDTLSGGTGHDSLGGGDGNDTINGEDGNDTLSGGAGNDTLNGGAGNDRISGGTGTDTVVIGAASTAVTITRSGSSFIISSAATGTDTILSDVENVKFTNGTFSLAAKNLTLTNGSDTGAAFTGGLNNDTFNARIDTQVALQTTYSGGDVLNGGGGTDQLRLQISGVNNPSTSAPPISLTSIETVTILNQNQNSGPTTLDASLWNGVTRIVAENGISSATTVIENVNALVAVELKANSSALVLDYNGAVLGGLADAQTLILSQSVGGFFSLAGNVAETLNIASRSGPNALALDNGNGHSVINVSGDQLLEMSLGGMNTVLTINAGTMTGGGVFIEDIGDSDITITGSGFDDGFIFGTGILTSSDVIDGGAGSDLLGFGQNNTIDDAALTNVTSIETLAVGNGASLEVQLGAQAQEAGIQTINAYEENTQITVNVIAGFTGALTVDLDATDGDPRPVDTFQHADTINASLLTGKLTVTALAGSFDGSDSINASTTNATDELKLIADNGTANLNFVTGIDLITVVAGIGAGVGNDIEIEIGNDNVIETGKTLTVNAAALTNSNANFEFDGKFETDSFNITGGNGADSLQGGDGNDVIDAGSGDDLIGGNGGVDNLKGGLGNDGFVTASGNFTAADTVDGGSGTDTLYIFDNGAVADAQFAKVTSVETIASGDSLGSGNGLTLTLGALAKAAGVTTIDGSENNGESHNIDITAAFNGALTVTLGEGFSSDRVVSASASALTVGVLANELGFGDTLTGGSGSTDTLRITADNGFADLGSVTNFETVTILANPALATLGAGVTTADATLAANKTLVVNAAALTNSSAFFYFDGSAESAATSAFNVTAGAGNDQLYGGAGNDTIAGGNGNDEITGGGGNDSLTGGAGNDTFYTTITNLTASDIIDGGTHILQDTLAITGAGGIIDDAKFTGVTNVEVLDVTAAGGVTATLGTEAFNAGNGFKRFVSSVNSDSLTIAATYTGAITADLKTSSGGADTVTATGSTAAVTVEAFAADISDDTLVGGSSLNDVLRLTADGNTATLGVGDSGFETITVLAGVLPDDDITISVADNVVTSGGKLTINATALTDSNAVLTVVASALGSTKTTDVTGGAGADSITGGAGNDTLAGGAGSDTLTGNGGVDSLTGGEGNDSITGGAGNDIINAGNGSDTVVSGQGSDTIDLGAEVGALDQDMLVFNVAGGGISGVATVANFDAATGSDATFEDRITILFNDAADGGLVRASVGSPVNDAKLIILDANPTGYFATFDAVTAADALQTGSDVGESYVFVWNDTTGKIHVSFATRDNAGDTAVDSPTDLAILTGVTFANLNLSDFII